MPGPNTAPVRSSSLLTDALRSFHAVAETGGFRRAADERMLTQGAISQQIAKLEQQLGQTLFERRGRQVQLNQAGLCLLEHAKALLELEQQTMQALGDLHGTVSGRLAVAASDTTAAYSLPPVIADYRRYYPAVELSLQNFTSLRAIAAVMHGDIDVAIVTIPDRVPSNLTCTPLYRRHDVMICDSQHRLAKRRRIHLRDLQSHPCLLLDEHCATRKWIDRLCRDHQVRLDVQMELASTDVIKRFVRHGFGISLVPAIAVADEVHAGSLAAVDVVECKPIAPQMGLVHRGQDRLSRAARGFMDLAIEHLASTDCRP